MDKLPMARNVIKVVALVVGGLGTVLCSMAVVGLITERTWIRVAVAVVFAIALPALLADRLMPEDPEQAKGATGDIFALTWMAVTIGVALGAGAVTRPVLAAEGDRLARADVPLVPAALYLLAGVSPTPAGAEPELESPPPTDAATTTTAATATAEGVDDTIPFYGPPSSAADSAAGGSSPAPAETSEESAGDDDDTEPELPPAIGDADVFDRALPMLATVTTNGPGGLRGGSAVFIGDDRVATCRHFFDDATSASLTFPDAREPVETLTIVAEDADQDLAIVRLIRPEHARPARLPIEDAPSVQRVIVIGDPLGLGPTLTTAAMSGPESPASFGKAIALTDAMLGSPVFDERGQLIGVVTRPDEPAIVDAAHIAATNENPLVKPRSVANEPKTR